MRHTLFVKQTSLFFSPGKWHFNTYSDDVRILRPKHDNQMSVTVFVNVEGEGVIQYLLRMEVT